MSKFMKFASMSLTALAFSCVLLAQPPQRQDSSRTNSLPNRPSTSPRPYKEIITDKAKTDNGLFKVHKVEDKYYFEIPDSLLNRDILVVNRISKAATGMRAG